MQVFWEKIGILGPVYRLVGRGWSDVEIAGSLDVTEVKVHECVAWIQRFLHCKNRNELVRYGSGSAVM